MSTADSRALTERVLDCFPSGSYALSALLRLLDIVASDQVPTAAVECVLQPRLLINPQFVNQHARSPEKLLMLVMHELHHVLLGHTTLFPTVTPVQNFVFDCVINALLSRMFPQPEHVAFFTDFYSDRRYPECLLRPPANWHGNDWSEPPGIAALRPAARGLAADVHRSLYSLVGATYDEVFEALPKAVPAPQIEGIPLLGNHDAQGSTAGALEARAPILFDIVRGVVEQWPQPPDPIKGRSLSQLLREYPLRVRRPPDARAALRALLRRVAGVGRGSGVRRVAPDAMTMAGPLPSLDRRSLVLRALGVEPLLHPAQVALRRPMKTGERVHVYLDVSGSVQAVRGALYGAVLDVREEVHPHVHLFSTQVADVAFTELRAGKCPSTGGTEIACVAEHMEKHRVRRALLVTDGFVGKPRGRHARTLAQARLAVGYAGSSTNEGDLAGVADYTRHVPLGG